MASIWQAHTTAILAFVVSCAALPLFPVSVPYVMECYVGNPIVSYHVFKDSNIGYLPLLEEDSMTLDAAKETCAAKGGMLAEVANGKEAAQIMVLVHLAKFEKVWLEADKDNKVGIDLEEPHSDDKACLMAIRGDTPHMAKFAAVECVGTAFNVMCQRDVTEDKAKQHCGAA